MTVLVSDSFNRANSTTSLGTTDNYNGGTAQTWQYDSTVGSWGISNNQAYSPISGTTKTWVQTGASDVSVQADITWNSNDGIIIRFSDINNYITARIGSSNIGLYKMINEQATAIGTAYSFTPKVGTTYTIKITASASNFTVYLNGSSIITGSDTFNQTATQAGIRANNDTVARFDNFVVSDLNTGSTSVPLTSTVKSTSSSTATASLTGTTNVPLSSTVKSSSNVTSAIKNTVTMISSVKSNTSIMATIKNSVALGSTVKSNSSGASNVANNQTLSSTVKSNSRTSNTIKDAVSLGAVNKSNTSSTANISLQAQGTISSVVKSKTSSSANVGVLKPLSSTVKSSSASSGTVTNAKPISSTNKSSSSSSAQLTVGIIFISSRTISRTSSTVSAQSSLSLITNVKSRTTSHASASCFLYTGPPVIHKSAPLYGSRKLHENLNGSRKLREQLGGYI